MFAELFRQKHTNVCNYFEINKKNKVIDGCIEGCVDVQICDKASDLSSSIM